MKSAGARELKENTGKALRRVWEQRESIEITWHGRAVARLIPVSAAMAEPKNLAKIWSGLDQLSEEIGARWSKGVAAVGAIREQRESHFKA